MPRHNFQESKKSHKVSDVKTYKREQRLVSVYENHIVVEDCFVLDKDGEYFSIEPLPKEVLQKAQSATDDQ